MSIHGSKVSVAVTVMNQNLTTQIFELETFISNLDTCLNYVFQKLDHVDMQEVVDFPTATSGIHEFPRFNSVS